MLILFWEEKKPLAGSFKQESLIFLFTQKNDRGIIGHKKGGY